MIIENGLTPGQRARVDQVLAGIRDVDSSWPYNQALMDNDEVRRVVFERLGESWPDGFAEAKPHLIWAHGLYVQLPLIDSTVITATTLSTAPTGGECDVCRCLKPRAGIAVVAMPIHLVPLDLCWTCADELDPESLLPTGVTDA